MQRHMVSLSEPVQVTACEMSTPVSETPSNLNLLENFFKISSNFKSFLPLRPPLFTVQFQHMHEKQKNKITKAHPYISSE